jgi:8-amino-7-oxononanoate synthase
MICGEEGSRRRAFLQTLIEQLSTAPIPENWQRMASTTAIQPLVIGSNQAVLKASADLMAQGVWISAIRAPTVPVNTARLRITLSASHTTEDVDRLVRALSFESIS